MAYSCRPKVNYHATYGAQQCTVLTVPTLTFLPQRHEISDEDCGPATQISAAHWLQNENVRYKLHTQSSYEQHQVIRTQIKLDRQSPKCLRVNLLQHAGITLYLYDSCYASTKYKQYREQLTAIFYFSRPKEPYKQQLVGSLGLSNSALH